MLPDWFLKPHPRYGTTSRLINLVVVLQIFTIVASRGDVLTLGEAYAFGVVWSFVFKSLAMLVLRFKRPGAPRVRGPAQYPGRPVRRAGGHRPDLPGAGVAAVVNLLTKEVATISGVIFTAALFAVFWLSERAHRRRIGSRRRAPRAPRAVQPGSRPSSSASRRLNLTKPYRKLVAIRSPYNLGMLERCLAETDPGDDRRRGDDRDRPAPGLGRLARRRSPSRTGSS